MTNIIILIGLLNYFLCYISSDVLFRFTLNSKSLLFCKRRNEVIRVRLSHYSAPGCIALRVSGSFACIVYNQTHLFLKLATHKWTVAAHTLPRVIKISERFCVVSDRDSFEFVSV